MGAGNRLEIIEIPIWKERDDKAPDVFFNEKSLGLNHLALDVTQAMPRGSTLKDFLKSLNDDSERIFQKSLRLVKDPYMLQVGQRDVYELAFIMDPDGTLIEILRFSSKLEFPTDLPW